jgi:CheY-like chemotaxis protein
MAEQQLRKRTMTTPPIRILLVDDEEFKLEHIIKVWLHGFDVHVETASTFKKAMEFIDQDFDLIICDYFLQQINYEQLIKKIPQTKPIKTGKLFCDEYLKVHCNTRTILYSGNKKQIEDIESKVVCFEFTEDSLHKEIIRQIYILSKEEKKEDNICFEPSDDLLTKEEVGNKKFWTVQKKVYAILGTIGLLITVIFGIVQAQTAVFTSIINPYIDERASAIFDTLQQKSDNYQTKINKEILEQLQDIRDEQIRMAYINRELVSPAILARARAKFMADSLAWSRK